MVPSFVADGTARFTVFVAAVPLPRTRVAASRLAWMVAGAAIVKFTVWVTLAELNTAMVTLPAPDFRLTEVVEGVAVRSFAGPVVAYVNGVAGPPVGSSWLGVSHMPGPGLPVSQSGMW